MIIGNINSIKNDINDHSINDHLNDNDHVFENYSNYVTEPSY